MSDALGGVCVLLKGPTDIIANEREHMTCDEPGSRRRSGGLGERHRHRHPGGPAVATAAPRHSSRLAACHAYSAGVVYVPTGDILAGTAGVMVHWAGMATQQPDERWVL
jgi:NAD(P)H-hydrate repair Nnr-like enzyme with NAD(P)H-hydrate dehydratase domain